MNPEEQKICDDINEKIMEHEQITNSPANVIVVDYSTWQRLKNIQSYYRHVHQGTDGEDRFAGIPIAVKMNKKEQHIRVY